MSASQIKPAATQTVTHFRKPERSFWQIWNMSFGFFGIQFGWGLQMANMAAIYTKLGAHAENIPILGLAGPIALGGRARQSYIWSTVAEIQPVRFLRRTEIEPVWPLCYWNSRTQASGGMPPRLPVTLRSHA